MTNFFYPFLITLFIHFLFVISSGLLIDKVSEDFSYKSNHLINVNFGSGQSSGGRSADKKNKHASSPDGSSVKPISSPNIDLGSNSSSSSSDVSPSIGSGSGNGSGNGSGDIAGSGSGSGVSFGEAVVSFKEPVYPKIALRRGIEGSLKVKIIVSPEGTPQDIIVLSSSGHDILDKAALEAVKVWKFSPQIKSYFVLKTIVFQIKN